MRQGAEAPRQPVHGWIRWARGARNLRRGWCRVSLTALAVLWAFGASAEIVGARYLEPTSRYAHGVLGDAIEFGALEIEDTDLGRVTLRLPTHRVFEDTAPRILDATGDGRNNVVVVESDQSEGARLAIYGSDGLVAATPFIGTRFRWLAPVAITDLDGDGAIELAYVDRPHLAKTLRVWRFADGALTEIARFPGVSNHRIGEPDIAGGWRDCGSGPEMIVADAQWRRLLALRLTDAGIVATDIGEHRGRPSFATALECR